MFSDWRGSLLLSTLPNPWVVLLYVGWDRWNVGIGSDWVRGGRVLIGGRHTRGSPSTEISMNGVESFMSRNGTSRSGTRGEEEGETNTGEEGGVSVQESEANAGRMGVSSPFICSKHSIKAIAYLFKLSRVSRDTGV